MQDSQFPQPLLLRQVCEGTVWMHTNRVSQAEMTEPSGKRSSKRREKGGNKREKGGKKRGKKGRQKEGNKKLVDTLCGLVNKFFI